MIGYVKLNYKKIAKEVPQVDIDFSDEDYTFLDVIRELSLNNAIVYHDEGACYVASIQFDYKAGEIYFPYLKGEKYLPENASKAALRIMQETFGDSYFYINNRMERYVVYKRDSDGIYQLQVDTLNIILPPAKDKPEFNHYKLSLTSGLDLANTDKLDAQTLFNLYIVAYHVPLEKIFVGKYLYDASPLKRILNKQNLSFYDGYIDDNTVPFRVYAKKDVMRFIQEECLTLQSQLDCYLYFNCLLMQALSQGIPIQGFAKGYSLRDLIDGKVRFIKYNESVFSLVLTQDLIH